MRLSRTFILSCAISLASTSPAQGMAQQGTLGSAPTADGVQQAVERVRAMYYAQDFEGGYREGLRLVRQYPNEPALRAWLIANQARNEPAEYAVLAADSLLASYPESPWSLFAKAHALAWGDERKEALPIARQALAREPRNPDMLWTNALVLYLNRKNEETVAFVDSALAVQPWAELVVMKGNALSSLGQGSKGDPAKFEEAFKVYEEARRMAPDNVYALHMAGTRLAGQRRTDEAYPLLKRAAELSPATGIHSSYWSAVQGLRDRTQEEKQAEILSDMEALLSTRGHYPGLLRSAAGMLGVLKLTDRQRELEETVLREYPQSVEAEWVLTARQRALAQAIRDQEVPDSIAAQREYVDQLRAYIARPAHRHKGLLGGAYLTLFGRIQKDSTVSADELLQIVEGMVEHDRLNPHVTHVAGPIALAERRVHFRAAERIAREGIEFAKSYYADRKEIFETVGEYADALDQLTGRMHDALGWVYFHEGRLNDAERELTRADELARNNAQILYHLGQLAEVRGQVETAEEMYAKGYGPERARIGGERKNSAALERLYQSRHGSLDAFDAYIGEIQKRDQAKRRQKIADSRIKEPEAVPAFVLERLGGGTLSDHSLKGKITVVNFWGMWCGPCVAEAPDLQKFYERYKDDPEVQFLTINNDRNPDQLPEWMEKKKLGFPVLLDDGYVTKVKVNAFPTTWFVNRDGQIVFEHTGASNVVLEEFIWRVEMLKEMTAAPSQ